MDVKGNSSQIHISELFKHLKNQVKIFDTLSKNTEPTNEQENIRNFILEYISNIISEEYPSEKCDIECFHTLYYDLWNLYIEREKFVDVYDFKFRLFDFDYIQNLCVYLNLDVKLIKKEDMHPQFQEIYLFINNLKILYFLVKNTKYLFNQINEKFQFDFSICILLYLVYNSKKHMDYFDTWRIGKTKTSTPVKFISQICLNFCYLQLFKKFDFQFVLFMNEEIYKNPLYNLFLLNSWKEEKIFISLFNDNFYLSKFCFEIEETEYLQNFKNNIKFLVDFISVLNNKNTKTLIPFNFNIYVNFINYHTFKYESFRFFVYLFKSIIWEKYNKRYEFLQTDKLFYLHKRGGTFNQDIKYSLQENCEVEFYKGLFILRYGLYNPPGIETLSLFIDGINEIAKYPYETNQISDLNDPIVTNFNIIVNYDNFTILSMINPKDKKIINKINFIKTVATDEEMLKYRFMYENNNLDMLTQVNFFDCSFNDKSLELLLFSLLNRKSNKVLVNLRFKGEEFLKNIIEFFTSLRETIDLSSFLEYPCFFFETSYSKVLLSFKKRTLHILNTSKKIEPFNKFIKLFEVMSQLPFEYLFTDFKLIGMSFTPDNVITKCLKNFKEYTIYDYAVSFKDICKYLSILEINKVKYKILQKITNFEKIFQKNCRKLEIHVFDKKNLQYPLALKKIKADSLIIQYFVENIKNHQEENKFYTELYDKKQNWTINLYYNYLKQGDFNNFYEHPTLDNVLIFKITTSEASGNTPLEKWVQKKLISSFTFYGEFSLDESKPYLPIFYTNKFKKLRKFIIKQQINEFLAYKKLQINHYNLESIII